MTSGMPEAFGFVPAHVVADLQDIGNWKSRATAIDALHKALKDVSRPQSLVASLPDFLKFLVGLIADPNFKIAISSMSILGDLAAKVGSELEPHLRVVVPALLEKFTDSKILVRSANMKVIKKLMGACSAGTVLGLLAGGSTHASWRVREEVVNTHIMALLSFGRSAYKPEAVFRLMADCMSDGKDKVRLVALEGMAVLGSKLGRAELAALLAGGQRAAGGAGGAPLQDALKQQVTARLSNPALPSINADGMVEHLPELMAGAEGGGGDMRMADSAFAGSASPGASKLPWGDSATTPARPRLRTAATPDVSGGAGGRLAGQAPEGSRREALSHIDGGRPGQLTHHHSAGADENSGLWSPSYRPVSLNPFGHAPSRLGSHESFTAGSGGGGGGAYPLAAASGWSVSGRPPMLGERPASPMRDRDAVPGGYAALHAESSQERSSAGSAPALHPLKHHWGAPVTRSNEGQPSGKSPAESFEESPLSPTRGFQQIMAGRNSAPTEMPLNHHPHHRAAGDGLDYIARPSSVRTQAAAELRGEPRAPPAHSFSHPPPMSAGVPQGHGGGGGAPSNMGLWLQSSLENDHAAARQETFSPSKVEMLARLKHRQIEKRAVTAQMETSAGSTELLLSSNDIHPVASGPSMNLGRDRDRDPRRHLFTQLSDNQRERAGGGDRGGDANGSRGYNSALNTPTRGGGAPANPFDETPCSARPPRNGPAGRLGRATPMAVETQGGGGGGGGYGGGYGNGGVASTKSPTLMSPGLHSSPNASEESLARGAPASPALNRLRARSADVHNLNPPATPNGGGGGPGPIPSTPGGGGPNGSFANGSFSAAKGRAGGGGDVSTEELTPVDEPERLIRTVIAKMMEANQADRMKLDWQGQYDALVDARRLVKYHTDVVRGCLHEFVRAAAPAIDQLRSQTSKCALMLFQEAFSLLGRTLDRELDEIVPVLIKKAGEVSNAGRDNFLAAEADRTLGEMCRCCSEARCVASLLACAGHKNPYVRGKVAFHLDMHLEGCAGTGRQQAIANNSAVMERLFKAAAAFLDEGGLDTRTYGKRIIWHVKGYVSSRGEFERLLAGVAPANLQRKVVDVVEGLNGPPPPPSRAVAGGAAAGAGASRLASRQLGPGGTPASPMRPLLEVASGGSGSGGGMLGSLTQAPPPVRQSSYSAPSPLGAHGAGGATPERRRGMNRQRTGDLDGIPEASVGSISGNGRGSGSTPARGGAGQMSARSAASESGAGASGFSPFVQETLVKSLLMLTAKDFRERMEALRQVEGVAGALPGAPDGLLVQLLDAVVSRLGDANAKVSMAALELVALLAATLRQRMTLGLNTLVPALAAALGAANDKIRGAAMVATDTLLGALDPGVLVQHFSHCVGNGTVQRGRPILVEKLVAIVTALHPSKPQLVARYAVPAAFALLNDSKGGAEGKVAANSLLGALARLMGPALLDQAGGLNAVAQQRVADAVAAAGGGGGGGGGGPPELRRGGSFSREVGPPSDRRGRR